MRTDRLIFPVKLLSVSILLALILSGCGLSGPSPAAASRPLTYSADVQPLVSRSCAQPCHHPGGPGPFPLLTYQDVRKRARQIVDVTRKRYMPPWLPSPEGPRFAGERRLSDDQIALLETWVQGGMAEGEHLPAPNTPMTKDGWQLGKPDLVLSLPQPYLLPAGGTDVFRNFIFPVPITSGRYVKALEILPGNKRIVHHANLLIDRLESSRRLDAADPGVGFGGMDIEMESAQFEPDTHFLFWKPGTPAAPEPPGMSWRLDPGTDLVLNVHLQPSGKPELVQPSLGLYFTDEAPSLFPMLLQLEHDGALDIPPAATGFEVTDEYRLPVDVQLLGIYPHAHYLGKSIEGWAIRPDGTRQLLIKISDWDMNWQAVYRYEQPVALPAGSLLTMRWTYDNSADNIRNPNSPPKRVTAGNRSSDEMAHLWIQVLPKRAEDRILLQETLMRARIRKYPGEFSAHYNLASVLQSLGTVEEAITHYAAALKIRPGDALALNGLGTAYQATGRLREAAGAYQQAVRSRPDYADAHYNLGILLLQAGQGKQAVPHFEQVLRARPEDADAHNDLGSALLMQGKAREALLHFRAALKIDPRHAYARDNMALAEKTTR